MSLRDDLLEISGVGESTADEVLAVVQEHIGDELDRAENEFTRPGGGGKSARLDRGLEHLEAAREQLPSSGE